jgi:serine protease AprX
MLIAVLDGGFLGANLFEPLKGVFNENRLIAAKDFVTNGGNPFLYSGHGTSAWSTIASDYKDFIGTAPKADFILCVTEDVASEYRIEEYNWLIAAEYADSIGVDIITSSLGYSSFSDAAMDYTYQDMDGQTAIITRASNLAIKKGILVITSAGNEGNNAWRYVTAPADGADNITVGSVKSDYSISAFSSQGPTADDRIKPDVVALGQGTTLLSSNGTISQANGTSFSAPLVAGYSAGIWQAHPEFTNLEVVQYIRNSGTRFDDPDNYFGYGIPIYLADEDSLSVTDTTLLSLSEFTSDSITIYPNPIYGNVISIKIDTKTDIYPLDIKLLDPKGNNISELSVLKGEPGGLISMDISKSRAGVYILILASSKISRKIKLIKY